MLGSFPVTGSTTACMHPDVYGKLAESLGAASPLAKLIKAQLAGRSLEAAAASFRNFSFSSFVLLLEEA